MRHHDFAIVIGIRRYPTLGGANPPKPMNLEAPDNDAKAVASWLASPSGGDLVEDHVLRIRSADFPDPFDPAVGPKPGLSEITKAFTSIVRTKKQNGRGGTFYLYVSGHGFGQEMHRGGLFTANADELDRDHFFAPSYFEWIRDTALFDQYVLWFDACSTRERLQFPKLASFTTMRDPNADRVRESVAYAARFFRKAVETKINGVACGVFTHTLLEGLKGGAVNSATGAVTTGSLKNYLINSMRQHMSETQLKDPDVSAEPDFGTVDDFELVPAAALAAAGVAPPAAPTPAGPQVTLTVESDNPATEIFIIDPVSSELRARGLKTLSATLPSARYIVRARLGRGEWQEEIALATDRTVSIPPVAFASAVPLTEPSWSGEFRSLVRSHESHDGAARAAAHAEPEQGLGKGVSLTVMARWWTPPGRAHGRLAKPHAGLGLRHHATSSVVFDLAEGAVEGDLDGDRWATRTVSIDPGLHTLVLRIDGKPAEMMLTALPGWQTQVFLLFEPAPPPHRKRLADISIQMWQDGAPEDPVAIRAADAARVALADERSVMSSELLDMARGKFGNPMMGLYALHLMLLVKRREEQDALHQERQKLRCGEESAGATLARPTVPERPVRFDDKLFNETLANTLNLFGEDHPDIRAIRFAAGQVAGQMPVTLPPMLWQSWSALVTASNDRPRLVPVDLWERVASQVLQRPYLVWMKRSAADIRKRTETGEVQKALAAVVRAQFEAVAADDEGVGMTAEAFGGPPRALEQLGARDHSAGGTAEPVDEELRRRLSQEMGLPRSVIDQVT